MHGDLKNPDKLFKSEVPLNEVPVFNITLIHRFLPIIMTLVVSLVAFGSLALIILALSSIMLFSPIIIGPASAII